MEPNFLLIFVSLISNCSFVFSKPIFKFFNSISSISNPLDASWYLLISVISSPKLFTPEILKYSSISEFTISYSSIAFSKDNNSL